VIEELTGSVVEDKNIHQGETRMTQSHDQSKRDTAARGLIGVSASPRWSPRPSGVIAGAIPGSSVGISYSGGPVVLCPQIYAGFWAHNISGIPITKLYRTGSFNS
jgi:hypothetical protein